MAKNSPYPHPFEQQIGATPVSKKFNEIVPFIVNVAASVNITIRMFVKLSCQHVLCV